MRLPIVGVLGSASSFHEERASALGVGIAELGAHLLTGGGQGVMESVSRAFHRTPNRQGLVIGVIPCGVVAGRPKDGYPNEWVELPIHTHLPLSGKRGTDPLSRNHINVLSPHAIVAVPG
ncbi:MAG: molybdenum cofactor carrier protein, partial [Gemmatimonadetes bacterium]|nr:molybdenum cofactor carrier protein [Gemmatimonadota bacterium]